MMKEALIYHFMYLQVIFYHKTASCSFVNMLLPRVYEDDIVKCGKAKCLHKGEIAEVIGDVFADDNSGNELVLCA
jgi:hypothetical protein